MPGGESTLVPVSGVGGIPARTASDPPARRPSSQTIQGAGRFDKSSEIPFDKRWVGHHERGYRWRARSHRSLPDPAAPRHRRLCLGVAGRGPAARLAGCGQGPRRRLGADAEVSSRFVGEARLLRRIDDDRVVRVYDIDATDERRPAFLRDAVGRSRRAASRIEPQRVRASPTRSRRRWTSAGACSPALPSSTRRRRPPRREAVQRALPFHPRQTGADQWRAHAHR